MQWLLLKHHNLPRKRALRTRPLSEFCLRIFLLFLVAACRSDEDAQSTLATSQDETTNIVTKENSPPGPKANLAGFAVEESINVELDQQSGSEPMSSNGDDLADGKNLVEHAIEDGSQSAGSIRDGVGIGFDNEERRMSHEKDNNGAVSDEEATLEEHNNDTFDPPAKTKAPVTKGNDGKPKRGSLAEFFHKMDQSEAGPGNSVVKGAKSSQPESSDEVVDIVSSDKIRASADSTNLLDVAVAASNDLDIAAARRNGGGSGGGSVKADQHEKIPDRDVLLKEFPQTAEAVKANERKGFEEGSAKESETKSPNVDAKGALLDHDALSDKVEDAPAFATDTESGYDGEGAAQETELRFPEVNQEAKVAGGEVKNQSTLGKYEAATANETDMPGESSLEESGTRSTTTDRKELLPDRDLLSHESTPATVETATEREDFQPGAVQESEKGAGPPDHDLLSHQSPSAKVNSFTESNDLEESATHESGTYSSKAEDAKLLDDDLLSRPSKIQSGAPIDPSDDDGLMASGSSSREGKSNTKPISKGSSETLKSSPSISEAIQKTPLAVEKTDAASTKETGVSEPHQEIRPKGHVYEVPIWGSSKKYRAQPALPILHELFKDLDSWEKFFAENPSLRRGSRKSNLTRSESPPQRAPAAIGSTKNNTSDRNATTLEDSSLRSPSGQPTNEFVNGLDDIDKLFEDIDPPDELDVAGDASMQEVLMGSATRVLVKRVRRTATFIRERSTRLTKLVAGRYRKWRDESEAPLSWLQDENGLWAPLRAFRNVDGDLAPLHFVRGPNGEFAPFQKLRDDQGKIPWEASLKKSFRWLKSTSVGVYERGDALLDGWFGDTVSDDDEVDLDFLAGL